MEVPLYTANGTSTISLADLETHTALDRQLTIHTKCVHSNHTSQPDALQSNSVFWYSLVSNPDPLRGGYWYKTRYSQV